MKTTELGEWGRHRRAQTKTREMARTKQTCRRTQRVPALLRARQAVAVQTLFTDMAELRARTSKMITENIQLAHDIDESSARLIAASKREAESTKQREVVHTATSVATAAAAANSTTASASKNNQRRAEDSSSEKIEPDADVDDNSEHGSSHSSSSSKCKSKPSK